MGQIHGAIVATSPEIARRAAKMVRVEYKDLPAIVTLEVCVAVFYFSNVFSQIYDVISPTGIEITS